MALGRGLTFEEEICRAWHAEICTLLPDSGLEARRLAANFPKLTASVAADKRDVTILLPHISRQSAQCRLDHNCGRFISRVAAWLLVPRGNLNSAKQCHPGQLVLSASDQIMRLESEKAALETHEKPTLSKAALRTQLEAALANCHGPVTLARRHRRRKLIAARN